MTRPTPTNTKALLLPVFIALGGFVFGYDMGLISGCLIMPDFIRRFGEPDGAAGYVLSDSRQSIITSLLSAGTFVGALGQALTSDMFGRKGSLFIWSAIFTVGAAVQTSSAFSLAQMTIGRFIAGLGVGALSALVPLYNGETAPKKARGIILALYTLLDATGIFIANVIELATHPIDNSASWRIPVGLQILWGLVLLSGVFFIPESPRYLLGIGRSDEARRVIAELNSADQDDPIVLDIMEELEAGILAENEGGKATWRECFSTRNTLWLRTINGMMLQMFQQLNGQNFYYYYGSTFFESAGTDLSPYAIQTILGAVSIVGMAIALYLIETWGRRKSLLTGSIMEGICALIVGVVGAKLVPFLGREDDVDKTTLTARNRTGGKVIISFAVVHILGFNMFWGPVPWAYLGESFPLRVRPKGIALGSATNWLWNFLLSFFAPRISRRIGAWIFMIFFGALTFSYFYVYLLIPEVKGLSLEEVDELYRSGVKPWNSSSWRPSEKNLLRHEKESTVVYEVREEKGKEAEA